MINNPESYSNEFSVEVRFPSQELPELTTYKVGDDDPTESIYSHVPITVIANIINKYAQN